MARLPLSSIPIFERPKSLIMIFESSAGLERRERERRKVCALVSNTKFDHEVDAAKSGIFSSKFLCVWCASTLLYV